MTIALLVPEITLLVFAVAVILLDLAIKKKDWLRTLSLAGILMAAGITVSMFGGGISGVTSTLAIDSYAIYFKILFLGIAFLVVLASTDYVFRFERFQGEYYALVMLSTIGMMLMASASDLISVYVSLELTSISLYALVGFLKDAKSSEASLKYLLLGAIASAVMLYGMAFIFGLTGTTGLRPIMFSALSSAGVISPALLLGIVLLIAGLGFKIAAVPFQMWVPDVYEGAPTPITAFLSVGSKAAGFAVIMRVFFTNFGLPDALSLNWGIIFAVLSVVSMTLGNVAAIPQANIKRMLGYSSIAQAGYLMVGLAALGLAPATGTGQSVVMFFLTAYALTNLGAFVAIIAISNRLNSDLIADYAGMAKRSPALALALTLCLVSLIGIPPAAGFMAKFFIFSAAVENGLLWLVIIAVINSVISAYYYLRVVKVMWFGETAVTEPAQVSTALKVALLLSCAGVLLLGVVPDSVMRLVEMAARSLVP